MKGTKEFDETIKSYLDDFAIKDSLFAEKYKNEKKSIKDCVQYILNTVKKSDANGFTDNEIFGMAIHYYDENSIDIGEQIDMEVKINRHVEITPEERIELEKKAKEKVFDDTAKQMKAPKKKVIVKEDNKSIQQSMF